MANSQPHSNPSLHAQLDATLARVVSDKRFMRQMDALGRESNRKAWLEWNRQNNDR